MTARWVSGRGEKVPIKSATNSDQDWVRLMANLNAKAQRKVRKKGGGVGAQGLNPVSSTPERARPGFSGNRGNWLLGDHTKEEFAH